MSHKPTDPSRKKVTCGGCQKSVWFPPSKIGKQVKCPGCGAPLMLQPEVPDEFDMPPMPARSTRQSLPDSAPTSPPDLPFQPQPIEASSRPPQAHLRTRKASKRSAIIAAAITGAICLVLGYFSGREHLKYQIRSEIHGALESFGQARGSDSSSPFDGGSTSDAANKSDAMREQIDLEIEELKEAIASAERDAAELKKFTVTKSRFSWNDSGFSTTPQIDLAVANGTDTPVTRAYFQAVLSSPGRSVPWIDDTFNYPITGGLEPGESGDWSLAPNQFGEWRKAPKDRDDMVLTVSVLRLDGPDGEPAYDLSEIDEHRARLEKLHEIRSEL